MLVHKPKVIFEQYVIPHYRIPFFEKLAEKVDLVVVASANPKKSGGINDIKNTGFRSIRLEQNPLSGLYHPGIIEVIKNEKPDVIISWKSSLELMMQNAECLSYLNKKNIKTIWMGCDGYQTRNFFFGMLSQFLPWRVHWAIRDFIVMRRVTHFIAPSSHTRDYWKRVKLVPENKITLANNAIDTSGINNLYRKRKAEKRKRDPRGIIFISRLIEGKNINCLIEAFAQISKKYPDAALSIVGEGPLEKNLREMVKNLGIETKIKFFGGVYDDPTLTEHMYQNSLFVLPGIGGLSFNTAMACGLPIIHTYADGTEKDIIEEGVNGWFFDGTTNDLVEKMDMALSNPVLLEKMGEKSEHLITQIFNLQNMVEGYISVIKKVSSI